MRPESLSVAAGGVMMPDIVRSAVGVSPFGALAPSSVGTKVILGGMSLAVAVVIAAAAARGAPSRLPEPVQLMAQAKIAGAVAVPPAVEEARSEVPAMSGPIRLTGVAGANLNAALAAAGVSDAIAQDYLRALNGRIKLADGISVADRFDLVIDRQGATERLVYAGLDRVGASDVQLMRWTVDGKSGWMDASDTGGAAEAMRMPVAAQVSSSFGMRMHPILGVHRFHRGVDLKATFGTPIRASADGRVAFAGWNGGYGRQVMIDHGQGLATIYAHMSRMAASPGERVHRGQVIGYVGSTGLSTGPHLHYEVLQNGNAVNPLAARYAGKSGLNRDEQHAFNATLRQLLTGGGKG